MILLYGIFGACIAGIPLAVLLIYQSRGLSDLKEQVSCYQAQEEASEYLTVWTLKEDIAAGDVVTGEELVQTQIKVERAADINSLDSLTQIKDRHAKTALHKGTVLQEDMFYDGQACTDDMRIKEITFVQLPAALEEKEYIDLRIAFPDGEDYIVVKHKKVLGLLSEGGDGEQSARTTGVRLELTEEELLRLSAARIDTDVYEDTTLYAIQYREDFQKEAVHDYPVNEKVYELMRWDPNIIARTSFAGERKKRMVLEQNLGKYEQESEGRASQEKSDNASAEPMDMTEQDTLSELEIFE